MISRDRTRDKNRTATKRDKIARILDRRLKEAEQHGSGRDRRLARLMRRRLQAERDRRAEG